MKNGLFTMGMLLSLGLFCACSSDVEEKVVNSPDLSEEGAGVDMSGQETETKEASTNPYERIIGSWMLVKVNEEDWTAKNFVSTYMLTDSTLIVYNPLTQETVSFEDDWTYDSENDVISGFLNSESPSSVEPSRYRFELKRKELTLSFAPKGWVSVLPPTPMVYYSIRKY